MIDLTTVRPWRNRNPGDLRTLAPPERWFGQAGTDDAPGGPFAIFVTPTDGWRALAMCLLTYQDVHHLRTVRGIANRFAPPADHNNTSAYQGVMCQHMGVGPDEVIDLHRPDTMASAVSAIAVAEGGALPWNEDAKRSGVFLALHLPVKAAPASAPIEAPSTPPDPDHSADALNDAELTSLKE